MRVVCDPEKVPRSVASALIKGNYEAPERKLVRMAVRPGDRVVDIGSGVGVVSLLCARLAGAGNVVSYEANAGLEAIIRENFALNNLTPRLRLRAVTKHGGQVSFFRNANVVSSSMIDRGLEAQQVFVESDPINRILAEDRANVLVMDVEGGEVDLLHAADLSGVRDIVLELHPHIVGESATQNLIEYLCSLGFTLVASIHKNISLTRV